MHITLNGARRTIRTVFQMLVGLAAMAPLIYSSATQHDAKEASGWAATALAISAAVTRIMALPAVENFLQHWVPWLSAKAPEYAVPQEDTDETPDLPADTELPPDPGVPAEPNGLPAADDTDVHQGA